MKWPMGVPNTTICIDIDFPMGTSFQCHPTLLPWALCITNNTYMEVTHRYVFHASPMGTMYYPHYIRWCYP